MTYKDNAPPRDGEGRARRSGSGTNSTRIVAHPDARLHGPLVLDVRELGNLLGVGRSTVYVMDAEEKLPDPIVIGKSRRWLQLEVEAWLAHGAPPRATWRRTWAKVRRELLAPGRQASTEVNR